MTRHVLLTRFGNQHSDNPFSAYAKGFVAFSVDDGLSIAAAKTLKINIMASLIEKIARHK
jgi:hypothetical protein